VHRLHGADLVVGPLAVHQQGTGRVARCQARRQRMEVQASGAIERNGGTFHRELKGGGGVDFEKKFRDPNGIVFDISHKGWKGAR